jgi:NAD(P)-dependent dehydrogenase (short-subunit alcohol dehydrogenase family)
MSEVQNPRPLALVTGGRRGIGRACCVALAQRGFDILAADIAEDGAEETAALVREAGGAWTFRHLDVADIGGHAAFVEQLWSETGGLACLVNNAGVGALRRGDLLDVSPESWDRVFGINARGSFFLTQAVARRMAAQASTVARSIVFISSANAALASPDRGEYCASKITVSMMARLFALRLAEHEIAVHEVRPGVIRTDLTAPVAEAYTKRIAEGLSPLRRWGEPEDIGRAVAMLAAGDMPFSTGDALHIDGGLHIGRL